ncbi:hypothetical protein EUX98_g1312 [Antrodiella citrinella]|uniref:Uncharacterized protein n=1 Tax=Antrodiella citrinella TaxID=2447956 RepID=A0A4S4N4N8_9APHY|nr:hypothetical protein EUX98_g1312 [Antrodiella citrinella]
MTLVVVLSVHLVVLVAFCLSVTGQKATLGLANGFINLTTPIFTIQLVNDSQTLYSLKPGNGSGAFDFIPADMMAKRQYNGNVHLGDISYRVRLAGSNSSWDSGDSFTSRHAINPLAVSGNTLAAADLSPALPQDALVNIIRRWIVENETLALHFDVTNLQNVSLEIGALGAPLEFNNIFTDRTAAEVNELCSLFDPYIGQDAGYVQVTPLLGTLPPLLVTPAPDSPLEGWRFIPEDTTADPFYQSQTFEGLYEWQFHTLAYAENEWAQVTPWNAPTSATLAPGETRSYGLQFRLAPSISGIEDTLRAAQRPVAVGIPGYVLSLGQEGKLFLNYISESRVTSLHVSPSNALSWTSNQDASNREWRGYTLTPHAWGRSRLTVTYADGTIQTVHFYVTNSATEVIHDFGSFLTTSQWFDNSSDPFHRSPGVITYDREANAVVRDDPRAWIPGLSDEAGAGSWLAATMKQFAQPNAAEVAKLEVFVNQTLWGSVQNSDGTVKKAVYYYQPSLVPQYDYPDSIDWGNWWSWNQAASYEIDRAYDYVHVTAAYWSLYRVARNYPSLVKVHTWQWYLNQAVLTVARMTQGDIGYADDGLMDETVIRFLLEDLKREGLTANATLIESRMRVRASIWAGERYPFGSEMAWDSTGQEGVYAWSTYFNDSTTALNVINSIMAYEPTVPHWGYNGNARRYWDNVYGGKLQRIERQIHHYGSGLNSLPLIHQFEYSLPSSDTETDDDMYLLRVAYGGLSGPTTNIDQDGFASASFHSFADTLHWDAYSGDYGPNFVGHALGIGTFIVKHPEFGWQAFGGDVLSSSTSTIVVVTTKDTLRRRVFVGPLRTMFTLDAGVFSQVEFDSMKKSVVLTITAAPEGVSTAASAPKGRLVVTQTAVVPGVGLLKPSGKFEQDASAWVIPFTKGSATVTLH